MNKILKNLGCLILIIIFSFLLKNKMSIYNIAGIIGIYFSIYFFIRLNGEEFENFEGEEIITILISYMLQKAQVLLYKDVYKNKLYLAINIIMMIIFTGLFLYKYYKNKKFSLENICDSIYNFLIITTPFFVIIGSKFYLLAIILYLIKSSRKKEYIWNKDIKKIYLSIFLLFLFSATSFVGNEFDNSQIKMFRRYTESLILLALFIQLKFSLKDIKYMISTGISASIIPVIPVLVQFLQIRNLSYRYGEDNANTWALEAALLTVIYLYFTVFKNKRECIWMYFLYIFTTILSGSRGPILAMIIVNILMFVYEYRKKIQVLAGIFMLTVLIGFGILNTNNRISYSINLIRKEKQIDNSSSIRLIIYKEAIKMFKEKPINGFGFNGYRFNSIKRNIENGNRELNYLEQNAYSQAHAHSNFFNFLCTTGILGTLSYISMIFFISKKIFKNLFKDKAAMFALSMIMVYELCGLVDCTMFNGSQQRLMYFIVGLYLAYTTPKISFSKKEKL